MRIYTPVSTSCKINGTSTLFDMIPQRPERNLQATANSHTVYGDLGCLMSLIGTWWNTVWASKFCRKWDLDSYFKSQLYQNAIHSFTGVTRQCGCIQVHITIQRMILWWKSMVQRNWIPQWWPWHMPSRLTTKQCKQMQCATRYRLQSPGHSRSDWRWDWPTENHSFWYHGRTYTWLISTGLRQRKQNWGYMWKDTLHKVLQEHEGFTDHS